jgi:hypothetical protein
MSLRDTLTKPRSRERVLFGVIGALFLVFAVRQASRSFFGVAIFLATIGLLAVLAAAFLSERALHRAGISFILVNIVAAAVGVFLELPQ